MTTAPKKTFLRCASLLAVVAALVQGCAASKEEMKPAQAQATTVAPARERTAAEDLAEGLAALKAKDQATAKARLEQAAAKDAKLFLAHYNLGMIAQSQSNLEEAARRLETALELVPGHEGAVLNLGKIYRDQQVYEKGISLYEKAVAQKPFEVNFLNNLSVFYRLAKKYDSAIAVVRRLLSRTKDNADAYKNLALIAFDQDQLRLAEFIGANAKKLDAKDPGVFNNLGLVYAKLGDRRGALSQFKKSVDLDKDFAPGHANIGALALSFRDYDSASRAFETVVRLDPNNAAAHLSLAWSYEGVRLKDGTHKTKEAVAEFEKVLRLVKDQPDAIYGIARAAAGELKDLSRAKEHFERYIALASGPAKEKARKDLAIVEQRIKAGAEAERMKKESEEKKKREEEEKRRKAKEQEQKGGSMLDKVVDEAAKEQPQEQPKDGVQSPPAPAPEANPAAGDVKAAAPKASEPVPAGASGGEKQPETAAPAP